MELRICTVAWKTSTGTFSDWIQVAGGLAHPGSPVTAISRAKGKADVFVVGSDQRVYTIVYDFLDNSVEWQPIGDLQMPSGLRVTPVLHSKDEVDIFVQTWREEFILLRHGVSNGPGFRHGDLGRTLLRVKLALALPWKQYSVTPTTNSLRFRSAPITSYMQSRGNPESHLLQTLTYGFLFRV